MKRNGLRYICFSFVSALLIALLFTSSDFVSMPVQSLKDVVIVGMQWGVMLAALFALMLVIASARLLFAVSFPVITVLSATLAYFRYTMNAVLTPMILDAALDNDIQTSADLVSPGLIMLLLFAGIISFFWCRYRWKHISNEKPLVSVVVGLAGLFILTGIDKLSRPISERIPFNIYYTVSRYLEEKEALSSERIDLSEGAFCKEDSLTVVLVIGESLRPDHLGINGYERNTTPKLQAENIISFPSVYTHQTYTMRSIPHLLTRADSSDFNRAYTEKSFVHIFNHCGFESFWLANQEPAKTFVSFMNECDNLEYANINKSSYVYDKWLDKDLLPLLDKALSSSHERKLIILHTIGSHWWYNSHFDEETTMFKPIVKSRVISSCTPEEMINSYDNTVVYTDYFLSEVINRLRNEKAVMIFQSDHGEALGEDGIWLHASETEAAHYAAGFVWMSDSYSESFPDYRAKAEDNSKKRIRTDYLFHSILDAAGISSDYIDYTLSIFR